MHIAGDACIDERSTGRLIQQKREELGISRETLAGYLRCSTKTVQRMEEGERDLWLCREFLRIAAFLQVSPWSLIAPQEWKAIEHEASAHRPLTLQRPALAPTTNGSKKEGK